MLNIKINGNWLEKKDLEKPIGYFLYLDFEYFGQGELLETLTFPIDKTKKT